MPRSVFALLVALLLCCCGCKGLKTKLYWSRCKEDSAGWNAMGYYLTSADKLRANMRTGQPLLYVGTVGQEDLFEYDYSSWDKIAMSFRLPVDTARKIDRFEFPGRDTPRNKSIPILPRDL